MMVRLCKDWLNWMIKNDEDATKRSMAKEYLNLMDELEQANARIDALVRDKDEQAGRIMRNDNRIKQLEKGLRQIQWDIDGAECRDDLDGIKGYIDEALAAIDKIGGKEDVNV
jgi:peptidoglycan hydrolase CwlO-like protein